MKTQEQVNGEFYDKFSFIQAIKNEKSGNAYTRITDHISSIRKNDIESLRKIVEATDLQVLQRQTLNPDVIEFYQNAVDETKKVILSHLSEELKNLD